MKNIAIITGRGGSKRIPRKNIRDFLGKPIIAYSIEAALESGLFDEVMVSTDDQEIADIARQYGAVVPFIRSEKNSDDFSGTGDVLIEVINEYRKLNKEFDYGCCLYPTAPFVTPNKLKESFTLLRDKQFDTVFPVVEFSFPILRALKMEDGKVAPVWPEHYSKRSQDLAPAYHDAGQFYWFEISSFLETKSLVSGNTGAIIVEENSVQDIDTEDDWNLAEMKYKYTYKVETNGNS